MYICVWARDYPNLCGARRITPISNVSPWGAIMRSRNSCVKRKEIRAVYSVENKFIHKPDAVIIV